MKVYCLDCEYPANQLMKLIDKDKNEYECQKCGAYVGVIP